MNKPILAYWFSDAEGTLRYDDGRKAEVDITHTAEGRIIPCRNGLHASEHPFDALQWAPGARLWLVELSGTVLAHDGNKFAASSRKYLASFDATDMLRKFARLCALDVVHLWDAPEVVVRYLKTGSEALRADAFGKTEYSDVGMSLKKARAVLAARYATKWARATNHHGFIVSAIEGAGEAYRAGASRQKQRARFARMVNYRMKKAMEVQR